MITIQLQKLLFESDPMLSAGSMEAITVSPTVRSTVNHKRPFLTMSDLKDTKVFFL